MRSRIILTALAAVALLIGASDATAESDEVAPADLSPAIENPYFHAWDACAKKLGESACGRHLVIYGWRNEQTGEVRKPTAQEVVEATERLVAMRQPPPAPEPVPTSAPVESTTTTPTTTAATSGGCPAEMAAEASSPTAVNPTSGASGCYQVLPSTAAAMGPACADVNAASCVAAICASQGNGAWSASGATPCG